MARLIIEEESQKDVVLVVASLSAANITHPSIDPANPTVKRHLRLLLDLTAFLAKNPAAVEAIHSPLVRVDIK